MARLTGGSFKRISPEDIKVRRSVLNQLVDVIQEDVSGSATRRAYQVFVTGGVGPGITSSLFQTVYDQDFTLQTANAIFDVTFGLYTSGSAVLSSTTGQDTAGKLLFPSQTLMMREKVDVYKQYASTLLGDADSAFFAPFGSTVTSNTDRFTHDRVDDALFLSFKRLFARDKIKRETFAMRFFRSASLSGASTARGSAFETSIANGGVSGSNINKTSTSGSAILTDIGAASNIRSTFGGEIGNIVNAANTAETLGLIFYDHGTVVLNLGKLIWTDQHVSGTIDAMGVATTSGSQTVAAGTTILGSEIGNNNAKFKPDFFVSASIDDIVDCFSSTRFGSGTLSAATFQNNTNINSTLIFCRATADEFNFSSNPTYTDTNGRIVVIDQGQEDSQRSFTFPTTVGLHDEFGNLLAVSKLSRPLEKNDEKDLTLRIRIDF